MRSIPAAWDHFFFTPADPLPLALIRIATGLLMLWSLGCLGLDLHGFLGSQGWADTSVLRDMRGDGLNLEWSFWSYVPDAWLRPAWVGAMIVLALFTIGAGSRTTAILAWAIAVSTSRRNPFILFGFDQIVTLWAFYLAVSGASGQSLSFDRWLSKKRGKPEPAGPTISANVGIRLIQLHLCVIYGAAGLAKLRGISWWDGSAMIKLLANAEFRPVDLSGLLSGPKSLYALNLATHLALATEILYPVLIWKKPIRPYVLIAAVFMHIGIIATLGLTEFAFAMLAGNLAFVPGAFLRRIRGPWHGSIEKNLLESSSGEVPGAPSTSRPSLRPGSPRR